MCVLWVLYVLPTGHGGSCLKQGGADGTTAASAHWEKSCMPRAHSVACQVLLGVAVHCLCIYIL